MKTINIGEEFITKNKGDAHGGYILLVKNIIPAINFEPENDTIELETQNMRRLKSGQVKITKETHTAKRWWINDYCKKIKR